MDGYTISEVASEAGVNQQTVRYYEREGLLPEAERTASNYRCFQPDAVRRIRFIKRAQELGFTLQEIRELLLLTPAAGDDCGTVRQAAAQKVSEIKDKIAALNQMRRTLEKLIDQCPGEGDLDECPILGAFDTGKQPKGARK